jgi:hypothetical protein
LLVTGLQVLLLVLWLEPWVGRFLGLVASSTFVPSSALFRRHCAEKVSGDVVLVLGAINQSLVGGKIIVRV